MTTTKELLMMCDEWCGPDQAFERTKVIVTLRTQGNDALADALEEGVTIARALKARLEAEAAPTPQTEATREELARKVYETENGSVTCWRWEDSGLDDEHPGARERYYFLTDALISEYHITARRIKP